MMAAPIGNKNAEKWTLNESIDLFERVLKLSLDKQYDFIGEIARDIGTDRHTLAYLADKFESLKPIHNKILANLEANCFSHAKKGDIREATAIVNLKSNYKWTDRQENTVKGDVTLTFPKDFENL